MKILQLCFRPQIPSNDGGAIAMYNISNGFVNNPEIDLSMFVLNTPKHSVKKQDIINEFNLVKVTCSFVNTQIKPLKAFLSLFSSNSYNIERFNCDTTKGKLKKLLQKETFDIIHFEGLYTSPLLQIVNKYAPNSKKTLRSHNIEYLIWQRLAEQATGLKKWYLNNLAKKLKVYEDEISTKFDAIIPITDIDKPYYESLGIQNIFTSSTGIELKDFDSNNYKSKNKVFHIGSLDWAPNQEAVIWFINDVWPLVLESIKGATFYVAGKNMPESFKQHHCNSIQILGEVENAQDFMQNHGVMVVPLHSGSGMRIKIIEGMACACPIVSTNIGAEGINYKEDKNIIIADTASKFAKAIIKLLKDQNFGLELGKNARENVKQNYSNQSLVNKLADYYKSLIS